MKRQSIGAKAANLEKLTNAGFKVPQFYILPAEVKQALGSQKKRAELVKTYTAWLHDNDVKTVAVRSSSTQEDGHENSYAGQFSTVLGVSSGDEFLAAVEKVASSAQHAAYSAKSGEVAVIVQEFIEPDVSGVLFTVNPANGTNEFVVNAASGRGTQVVDGGEVEQHFVDRLDADRQSLETPFKTALLTQSQITELTETALRIETLFAFPQDIEWAIKDNTVYILQARPITRLHHLRLWDSSNISESFPGIVLPLTFSIAKRGYMLGYKAQAYAAGLSWYEIESHHRMFDAMIGIFNGRMYYNLLNWYTFISLFPGGGRNQQFLDDQIATQGQALHQLPKKHALVYRVKFVVRALYRVVFFSRELRSFYARYEKFEQDLACLPQHGNTQLLMEQYAHIEQTIIPHFGRTVDNDFLVMTYHGWLKRCLGRWLPKKSFENTNIIGSVSGVLSAEQALSLYRLAAEFAHDAQARTLLKSKKYSELDGYLQDTPLGKSMQQYVETFGHRFAEDQKIEAMNPVLQLHGMYAMLQPYMQLDQKEIEKRLKRSVSSSKRDEHDIKQLLNPLQTVIYTALLWRLKHHLRIREKNRLLRGKVYGYLRELFVKVGNSLANEGVIADPKDVYYLQIEELYQLLQGSVVVDDMSARIAARKKAYKTYKTIAMPERFVTKGMPSLEKIVEAPKVSSTIAVEKLSGLLSSPGTVEGRVLVLDEPAIPDEPFDILVARHTDPGWTPLIALAKGVIVEHGGMLSHAAIVTRELGIPSIIGVKDAASVLKTGMRVRINSQTAQVEILSA